MIQPRILGGTVQQAVMSLGVGTIKHALHGPRHVWQEGMQTAESGLHVAAETARHPLDYGRWGAGVMTAAAELAGQVAKHLTTGEGDPLATAAPTSLPADAESQRPAIVLRIAEH